MDKWIRFSCSYILTTSLEVVWNLEKHFFHSVKVDWQGNREIVYSTFLMVVFGFWGGRLPDQGYVKGKGMGTALYFISAVFGGSASPLVWF